MTEVSLAAAGNDLLPDGGQLAAGPSTDTDQKWGRWEAEELAAGRFLTASQGGGASAALVGIVVSLLAGMGLRAHLPHPSVAVVSVIAGLAVLTIAAEAATVFSGRLSPESGWARDMERYRRWLSSRQPSVPQANLAVLDHYLAKATGWRWRSAHLMVARRPSGSPWIPMGYTNERGARLMIYVGEHVLADLKVLSATLAHETRHMRGWRRFLRLAYVTGRNRGYLVIGWALPWPNALWAALALHLALTLTSWVIEASCDLGAAADTSPEAMRATFDLMAHSVTGAASGEPGGSRAVQQTLYWAAGPEHPPIPVRRALTGAYYRLRPHRRYPAAGKQPTAKT